MHELGIIYIILFQVRALISKLTEEKAAALQQGNKLRQELVRITTELSCLNFEVSVL